MGLEIWVGLFCLKGRLNFEILMGIFRFWAVADFEIVDYGCCVSCPSLSRSGMEMSVIIL